MGTFGDKLRREREMRAVTLEEIAEATKIGTRSLKALEEEHFDILPGGIFNKGFVRAYAKYLGIDQEQAVNDYLTASGEEPSEKAAPKEIEQIASQAEVARQRKEALQAASGKQSNGSWLVWAALLLLVAAGAGGWKYYEQWKIARTAAAQAATAPVVQAVPAPVQSVPVTQDPAITDPNAPPTTGTNAGNEVGTTPSTANGTSAANATIPSASEKNPSAVTKADAGAATPAEFQVQLHVKERSWVRITSDGTIVREGMMSADEARTYAAKSKLIVLTGKPGAIEFDWNGKKQSVPKVSTASQILVFTPEGMQQ